MHSDKLREAARKAQERRTRAAGPLPQARALPPSWAPWAPSLVRSRCSSRCRCGGGAEWIVRAPWVVVDVDCDARVTVAELLDRARYRGAYKREERATERPRVRAIVVPPPAVVLRSACGGVHLHFPELPVERAHSLARLFPGGDVSHARISGERGWSGERPAPAAAIEVRRDGARVRELLAVHATGRNLITLTGAFDGYLHHATGRCDCGR